METSCTVNVNWFTFIAVIDCSVLYEIVALAQITELCSCIGF